MINTIIPNTVTHNAAPELPVKSVEIRSTVIDLTTAQDKKLYKISGSFLAAVASSSLTANMSVQFNDIDGGLLPVKNGLSIGGMPFNGVFVTNTAQAGENITIITTTETPMGPFRLSNSGDTLADNRMYVKEGSVWSPMQAQGDGSNDEAPVGSGVTKTMGRNTVWNGTDWVFVGGTGNNSDTMGSESKGFMQVLAWPAIYDEYANKFNRLRANSNHSFLTSVGRTLTTNSTQRVNYNHNTFSFFLSVTALTSTPSVELTIIGKDAVSGVFYEVFRGTAVTSIGTYRYLIGPSLIASAGSIARDFVPRDFRVTMEHANTDSITYSVGGNSI